MNHMYFTSTPCALLLVLALSCCDKVDSVGLPGCCDSPAIEKSNGDAYIYVPNIFTPDNDYINDFLPVLGQSIHHINSMEIKTKDGNVVFYSNSVKLNQEQTGWDGRVQGVVIKGLYTVVVDAETDDGTILHVEGKVCNYPCHLLDPSEYISRANCQFGDQLNGQLHYDATVESNESPQACFID